MKKGLMMVVGAMVAAGVAVADQPTRGVVTLDDGARYEGELRDGEPHGQGVYTSPDGKRYEGEVEDGKLHGQGVLTFPDGTRQAGEFKNGVFQDG